MNVHALSMVKFFQLFGKDSRCIRNGFGWKFIDNFVKSQKIYVICRVDGRSYAIDCVRARETSPQYGIVFNVINTKADQQSQQLVTCFRLEL